MTESLTKLAFWAGLISACIAIFSFFTGIATLPDQRSAAQVIRGDSQTTNSSSKETKKAEAKRIPSRESTLSLFGHFLIRMLKLAVVLTAPLFVLLCIYLLFGLVSKLYDICEWEYIKRRELWDFQRSEGVDKLMDALNPVIQGTVILLYFIQATVLFISFFPDSFLTRGLWWILNFIEN